MPDKLTYKKVSAFDDNKKFFYNFFLQNGYSPHASAGIVGNLVQESGLNVQIDKPYGFGSAQWIDSRKTDLFNFSKQKGYAPTDRLAQAQFILHELNSTHKKANTYLKGARNVDEATEAFSTHYERAGKPMLNNRIKYANEVLTTLGGTPAKEPLTWKWKRKSDAVTVNSLDNNILAYLDTLEPEYQEMLIATAGSDGTHSRTSRHYKSKAIDLRYNQALWNRVEKDPNRIKYGITLLDPNHGTGPHLHLSVGNASENKSDVWLDPHSEKAYAMVGGMSEVTNNPSVNTVYDNHAEQQTLTQTPLDDSYIRKELSLLHEKFEKKDESDRINAENESARQELLRRQTERDFLVAQTLSAKLPYIERGY